MNIAVTLAYIRSRIDYLNRVIQRVMRRISKYKANQYKLESRIRKMELEIRALKSRR